MISRLTIYVFIFLSVSILIVWYSRNALRKPDTHGFYRTFAFETILLLILLNIRYWFTKPFQWYQIVSWLLLIFSLVMVYEGFCLLKKAGDPDSSREDSSLIDFEKTTKLVTVGVYARIRHPLYGSLLFLAWGTFFKHLSWPGLSLVMVATTFLVFTAKAEEKENLIFFGDTYRGYMKKTKMFIPFLF